MINRKEVKHLFFENKERVFLMVMIWLMLSVIFYHVAYSKTEELHMKILQNITDDMRNDDKLSSEIDSFSLLPKSCENLEENAGTLSDISLKDLSICYEIQKRTKAPTMEQVDFIVKYYKDSFDYRKNQIENQKIQDAKDFLKEKQKYEAQNLIKK